MARIPRVKAGDTITEGLLNRIVDQFERFAKLSTSSPCILLTDGPYGKLIDLDLPQPTYALLSGSSSPYSWTEVRDGPSGTWDAMTTGDSGTAYEVNSKAGLDGKVVPITWTAAGDWRFAWIGYGPPPPCEAGRICVTVQQSGCAFDLEGITVTVTDDADPPNEIGSGTTSGSPGTFCVDLPTAGTYHVTASVPGTDDQTSTINAVCGIDNGVTLTFPPNSIGWICVECFDCDCEGQHAVGAGVTTSGKAVVSGSTDGSTGQVCFAVAAGNYTVTASYPSGFAESEDVTVNGCTTTSLTIRSVSALSFYAHNTGPGCTVTFEAYYVSKVDMSETLIGSCSVTTTFDGVTWNGQCCLTYDSPVSWKDFVFAYVSTSGGTLNHSSMGDVSSQCRPTSNPISGNFATSC